MRNNQNQWEDWDRGVYQNGSTQLPKSHGGLVAVLLVTVILLCSLVSILGILNIRLFQSIHSSGEEGNRIALSSTNAHTEPSVGATAEPREQSQDVSIELNKSPQGVENVPQAGGLSLQAIYEKAIDSVVSISCTSRGGGSSGTGVVLTQDGYVLTNCHVVESAQAIIVRLSGGRELEAELVGADAVSDLAVLKVEARGLTPAELGDSGSLRVGDAVVAIGDPLGAQLHGTMTDGIVSAINRDILVDGRSMTLIQTNAALNSGNSGGPLLNCYGQVVGINTMKLTDSLGEASVEGLGFAIPTTTVRDVVNQLLSQGYVSGRPDLGLECQALSPFEQMFYQFPAGLYVSEAPGQSQVRPGDILLSLDGTRITSMEELNLVLYSHQPGDTVSAVFYRRGSQYPLNLVLGEAK